MNERTLIDFLSLQNVWWKDGKKFPNNKIYDFKRRDYFYILKNYLKMEEALVIIGSRGVGKSTVLFEIMRELLGIPSNSIKKNDFRLKNKIDYSRIFYVSFDHPTLRKSDLLNIINVYCRYILKEDISQLKKSIYVFFDEIQNIENWGDQLKFIQDLKYPIKFFVSGSSSVSMNNEISKGARRFEKYLMCPLKFIDFLRFHKIDDESFEKFVGKYKSIRARFIKAYEEKDDPKTIYDMFLEFYADLKPWKIDIEILFDEYLIKGGYPKFLESKDYNESSRLINQTFRFGFHKDLVSAKGIGNPVGMMDLAEYIASISSSETNYSSLAKNSGLSINSEVMKNYLYHLEQSCLVSISNHYPGDSKKKSPSFKIYFPDIAIRNMLMGVYNKLLFKVPNQLGYTVHTAAYDHISRLSYKIRQPGNVYYNIDKKEVDMIIKINGVSIPIEVKTADDPSLSDVGGLRAFCKKYKVPGIVLCKQKLDLEENVIFLPHWLFFLIC